MFTYTQQTFIQEFLYTGSKTVSALGTTTCRVVKVALTIRHVPST